MRAATRLRGARLDRSVASRSVGAPAARSATWALVGRDEELDLLDSASRAGPVVVAGPAGVGKTRLVADWLAR